MAAAALLAACAVGSAGPGPSAGATPGATPGRPAGAAPPPPASLDRVASLVAAGAPDSAAILADSLYFAWRAHPDTRERAADALWREVLPLEHAGRPAAAADRLVELLGRYPSGSHADVAVRELARLRIDAARAPGAVDALLARPDALDDSARALLRVAASRMSSAELEDALAGAAASRREISGRDRAVLEAALARELARAGRSDSASRVAGRVLSSGPRGPERALADSVRSGTVGAPRGPLVLGAILPTSGRYQVVGSWLREGIDLALREAAAEGAPEVRLRVVDEGDDPAAVPGLVRQLEDAGAVAILGPVRSRALADAAAARTDPGLALVSPTATDAPTRVPGTFPLNAYALWDSRRRQADAVRDLGRWLGDRVGVEDAAILFARDAGGMDEALAFRAGLAGGAGSGAVASAAFDPDSTTFRGPIARVGAFGPTAVFVAGGSSATLLQLAPQLSYFGARDALVVGGPGWAEPGVVRRLEPSPTQERVVATYLDWSDPRSGWSRFRASYEKKYGKSLGSNMVPGLGYDAARLLLAALPRDGVPHAGVVARRLASLSELEGATGTLSPDASTGTVARRTLLRVIEDRRLSPADPDSVKAWLGRSGFLEAASLRRQRAAARQAVREATPDSSPGGRP